MSSMTTPIVDFVRQYARSGTSRLHMPGHKGQPFLGCEAWDITEIKGADELYEAEGIIARSEANATALFGTVGVLSGFMALQGWGSRTQSDTGKLSWRRGILLLAAGTGILAMLGTEGDKTDYAAHLFGLLSGFIVGGASGWISRRTAPSPVINTLLGLSAAGLVVLCWRLAL